MCWTKVPCSHLRTCYRFGKKRRQQHRRSGCLRCVPVTAAVRTDETKLVDSRAVRLRKLSVALARCVVGKRVQGPLVCVKYATNDDYVSRRWTVHMYGAVNIIPPKSHRVSSESSFGLQVWGAHNRRIQTCSSCCEYNGAATLPSMSYLGEVQGKEKQKKKLDNYCWIPPFHNLFSRRCVQCRNNGRSVAFKAGVSFSADSRVAPVANG